MVGGRTAVVCHERVVVGGGRKFPTGWADRIWCEDRRRDGRGVVCSDGGAPVIEVTNMTMNAVSGEGGGGELRAGSAAEIVVVRTGSVPGVIPVPVTWVDGIWRGVAFGPTSDVVIINTGGIDSTS